jgi:hypothetical protein
MDLVLHWNSCCITPASIGRGIKHNNSALQPGMIGSELYVDPEVFIAVSLSLDYIDERHVLGL